MRRLIFIIIFFSTSLILNGAEQEYKRKSISSPGFVWVNNTSRFKIDELNLGNLIKNELELKRFDQNTLPNDLRNNLQSILQNISSFSSDEINSIYRSFVVDEILSIVSSENILKERKSNFETERRVTLAETKGKSSALTEEQLNYLLNTAYIYFPYINSIETNTTQIIDKARYTVKIKGGLIWYHITDDGNGNKDILEVAHIKTSGSGVTTIHLREVFEFRKNNEKNKKYFPLLEEEIKQEDFNQAFLDAFDIWTKNIVLSTRERSEFRLRSYAEPIDKKLYKLNLSNKDGIYKDSSFYLMYLVEENGIEKARPLGFGYINSIYPNKNHSTLKQITGKDLLQGAWVEEAPQSGISLAFSLGSLSTIYLPKSQFKVPLSQGNTVVEKELIKNDIKKGTSFHLRLQQNLAKISDISQFFAYFDFGINALNENLQPQASGIATLSSFAGGLQRKWWFSSRSIGIDIGVGLQDFRFNGSYEGYDYSYQFRRMSLNSGLHLEQKFSPYWSVFLKYTVSHGFGPWSREFVFDSETVSDANFSDKIDLSGQALLFGIQYDLKRFNFNFNTLLNSLDFLD